LPILSANLRIRIWTGITAAAYMGTTIALNAYPKSMKGLLRPILSLHHPENALRSEAVLSATPSISESSVFDAPIESKNKDITEYTILVAVSMKKLVRPAKKMLLSRPRIFFTCTLLLILSNQITIFQDYSIKDLKIFYKP